MSSSTLLPILGGIIIATITGLVSWRIAKESSKTEHDKFSGTVETSNADTLWAQSLEMRNELRAQIEKCEQKCTVVETENKALRDEVSQLQNKVLDQKGQIIDLKEHLSEIKEDLHVALREVARQADGVRGDVATVKAELALIQGGSQ